MTRTLQTIRASRSALVSGVFAGLLATLGPVTFAAVGDAFGSGAHPVSAEQSVSAPLLADPR